MELSNGRIARAGRNFGRGRNLAHKRGLISANSKWAGTAHGMNLATPATHDIGWIVLAASFGFALIQLDVTIVNVALPSIANAFGAHVAELQWVVDAYAVCFAALLLSAGFLGDRFGARRIYLSGMTLFAAASLACGLAPGPVM